MPFFAPPVTTETDAQLSFLEQQCQQLRLTAAGLTDEQARARALHIFETINEPNLLDNVLPTRGRATLVLTKGADHQVRRIRLRKL